MMVQRCALEEISVEWVPNFPLKRLYVPEKMTKDICLGENRLFSYPKPRLPEDLPVRVSEKNHFKQL